MIDTMPELTEASLIRARMQFAQKQGTPARTLVVSPGCERAGFTLFDAMIRGGVSAYNVHTLPLWGIEVRLQEPHGTWHVEA